MTKPSTVAAALVPEDFFFIEILKKVYIYVFGTIYLMLFYKLLKIIFFNWNLIKYKYLLKKLLALVILKF